METALEDPRKRRPHNQVKTAIREFLSSCEDRTATIAQITAGTMGTLGSVAPSTYRTTLQDQRYFKRVRRGVFRLVDEEHAA